MTEVRWVEIHKTFDLRHILKIFCKYKMDLRTNDTNKIGIVYLLLLVTSTFIGICCKIALFDLKNLKILRSEVTKSLQI